MKLHIGGTEVHPDWKILDVEARPEVDFVGNAANLEQFADNSIEAIYASVESFGFFNDTSIMRVENTLISLNVIATK